MTRATLARALRRASAVAYRVVCSPANRLANRLDPPAAPPVTTTSPAPDPDGAFADEFILRDALHRALHRYSPAPPRGEA